MYSILSPLSLRAIACIAGGLSLFLAAFSPAIATSSVGRADCPTSPRFLASDGCASSRRGTIAFVVEVPRAPPACVTVEGGRREAAPLLVVSPGRGVGWGGYAWIADSNPVVARVASSSIPSESGCDFISDLSSLAAFLRSLLGGSLSDVVVFVGHSYGARLSHYALLEAPYHPSLASARLFGVDLAPDDTPPEVAAKVAAPLLRLSGSGDCLLGPLHIFGGQSFPLAPTLPLVVKGANHRSWSGGEASTWAASDRCSYMQTAEQHEVGRALLSAFLRGAERGDALSAAEEAADSDPRVSTNASRDATLSRCCCELFGLDWCR